MKVFTVIEIDGRYGGIVVRGSYSSQGAADYYVKKLKAIDASYERPDRPNMCTYFILENEE